MSQSNGVEIAIIGMAGRFPGAADVDAFWRNICHGTESITWFSEAELRECGVSAAEFSDPAYVRAAAVLGDMDLFDAAFFGYLPRDAERLDPQHRVFLETAWQALEHAGYAGATRPELTGIYAGSGANLYLMRHLLPAVNWRTSDVSELIGLLTSNDKDTLATRVAYKLDLRGPAVSVQTACSTSLTAVHMACRALLNHEADLALAGGVSLNLLQNGGYRYQQGAILSADGHCRAFDAKATGTLVGSGAGIVVLKRLTDAVADRDTVYAIIKGSALNNDGATKVGFTAPSVNGQADVIVAAQAMADVAADSIGYVEAHGTGTTLGDPIEFAALTQAFRSGTQRRKFCALGSVKTNVGHLDAAAGVTGLIKTALALHHRTLTPSLNFEQPNPQIDLSSSPFFVITEARPWPVDGTPRRAGVSSFGMGGTNVHVVLEQAEVTEDKAAAAASDEPQLLVLSARSSSALDTAGAQLANHLEAHLEQSLADVAHTLRVGRRRFEHRCVALATSRDDAVRVLRERPPHEFFSGRATSAARSVAFLFPGQGSQHAQMGRALYEREPAFREVLDRCRELFQPHLALDLRGLLFPSHGDEAAAERLQQTWITQPALFSIEYALAQWWIGNGVRPAAMLGHSIGEYVAACLAGVFSFEEAVNIVAARGRLVQSTQPGAMLAVNLQETSVQAYLRDGCDLAAVNTVDSCVISGATAAIEAVECALTTRGVAHQRLRVSHAFHSAQLAPVMDEFHALLSKIPLQPPTIPFVSNLTGRWITSEQARDPAYWVSHLRHTVRFADGVGELLGTTDHLLLEVGPSETLSSLARRHPQASAQRFVGSSQCSPARLPLNANQLLRCAAELWIHGVDVGGTRLNTSARRVPLPLYPFERQSYWVGKQAAASPPAAERDISEWFYAPSWKRTGPVLPTKPLESTVGVTLLLSDAHALSDCLSDQLQAQNRSVVRVERAAEYRRAGSRHYLVRPDSEEDLERLLSSVSTEIGAISTVCHLWSLQQNDGELELDDALQRGFYSLLELAHALSERLVNRKASILVVTNQVEDVSGTESLCAEKATLHGACKVIPQEYENLQCRLIDVALASGETSTARIARNIAAEMSAPEGSEPVVAYRGPHRLTKSFLPVRFEPPGMQRLKKRGVYVITGGLGGIGLTLSRHLAANWQARLALISRSPLPDRSEWTGIATAADQPEPLRRKLRELLELEELGAEVMVLSADVADRAGLREALDTVTRRYGVINGVIHAAGEVSEGTLGNRSREAIARVLKPKVQGTTSLLDALEDAPLDFVLLCSSLAAVLGGLGRADYSAANCFLDATAARSSRHADRLVLAVNWDGWREVGMAASQEFPKGGGIAPEQGGPLLEMLLSGAKTSQILVSTVALDRRLNVTNLEALADLLLSDGPTAEGHKRPRHSLSVAYAEPASELEHGLAALWEDSLGIAPIGIDDNLFELGGDSLLAIRLLAGVQRRYGVELHPASFVKSPTIASLALLVESRLLDEIEAPLPAGGSETGVAMLS